MTKAPTKELAATADAKQREREHNALTEQTRTRINALRYPLVGLVAELGDAINGHMQRQGFWVSDNFGEKVALMHSELSEALEADRKDLMSDKIPEFTGVEEEFADTIIRLIDTAHQKGLRLADAIVAKMDYNLNRPFMHGKKY